MPQPTSAPHSSRSLGAEGIDRIGDRSRGHRCVHMGARRPGLDAEIRVVSIFHFRDGRQIERWFFPEDAEAWDRILGGTAVVGRAAYSGR